MTFTEDPDFDKEQLRAFTKPALPSRKTVSLLEKSTPLPASLSSSIPRRFSTWCARAWRFMASIPKTSFATPRSWISVRCQSEGRVIYVKRLRKGDSAATTAPTWPRMMFGRHTARRARRRLAARRRAERRQRRESPHQQQSLSCDCLSLRQHCIVEIGRESA